MSIDEDFFTNPYPYYLENRLSNTLKYFELNEEYESPGFWGIFRYNEALEIFKNTISTSKDFSLIKDEQYKNIYDLHLLNRDNEAHARLRKLTLSYFATKSIIDFNGNIEKVIEKQINFIKNKSEINLIRDFADEIPVHVILKIIGIETEEISSIKKWLNSILIDSLLLDESLKLERKNALNELTLFVKDSISNKNIYHKHSLICSLIDATKNGKLNQDELIAYIMFLIVAGHQTSADLIGNSLYMLLVSKDLFFSIISNPMLVDSFIEEVLRYESPVQRTTFRVLNEDTFISGTKLKQGDQVRIFIGSVNRDGGVFTNPDVFDIYRKPNAHFAFGLGAHNCLGQFLARAEAKISILKISQLLTKFNLVNDKPQWKRSNFSRGLEEIKVSRF